MTPSPAPAPGITRRVLSQRPEAMVVSFTFAVGAEGARHSHPHLQTTFVRSGRFRFGLGEGSVELGPGDALVIPGGTEHGCLCLEAGELIDTFAPRRDDFL